jgi:hypothetical protein
MEPNKDAGPKDHTYIINGKVWIVGEKKISMWSKAKCNQEKKEDKDKEEKEEKITLIY